jgi:hypothetical protein
MAAQTFQASDLLAAFSPFKVPTGLSSTVLQAVISMAREIKAAPDQITVAFGDILPSAILAQLFGPDNRIPFDRADPARGLELLKTLYARINNRHPVADELGSTKRLSEALDLLAPVDPDVLITSLTSLHILSHSPNDVKWMAGLLAAVHVHLMATQQLTAQPTKSIAGQTSAVKSKPKSKVADRTKGKARSRQTTLDNKMKSDLQSNPTVNPLPVSTLESTPSAKDVSTTSSTKSSDVTLPSSVASFSAKPSPPAVSTISHDQAVKDPSEDMMHVDDPITSNQDVATLSTKPPDGEPVSTSISSNTTDVDPILVVESPPIPRPLDTKIKASTPKLKKAKPGNPTDRKRKNATTPSGFKKIKLSDLV